MSQTIDGQFFVSDSTKERLGKPAKMTLDQFYRYCFKCPYLHDSLYCTKLQQIEGYCFHYAKNRSK